MSKRPNIDERELATVLAALRYWQARSARVAPDQLAHIDSIACNGGDVEPLDLAEIDTLCERLNVQPHAPQGRLGMLLNRIRSDAHTLNSGKLDRSDAGLVADTIYADAGEALDLIRSAEVLADPTAATTSGLRQVLLRLFEDWPFLENYARGIQDDTEISGADFIEGMSGWAKDAVAALDAADADAPVRALLHIIEGAPTKEPEYEEFDGLQAAEDYGYALATYEAAEQARVGLRGETQGVFHLRQIRGAIVAMKFARDELRQAKAPKAANYVARALKSAEGAQRHAQRGDIIARREAEARA